MQLIRSSSSASHSQRTKTWTMRICTPLRLALLAGSLNREDYQATKSFTKQTKLRLVRMVLRKKATLHWVRLTRFWLLHLKTTTQASRRVDCRTRSHPSRLLEMVRASIFDGKYRRDLWTKQPKKQLMKALQTHRHLCKVKAATRNGI